MDRMTTMEVFCRIVEAGSFSAAARDLKMGQPAVSKCIAQLEEKLGVRLLLRSARNVTATVAGMRFYARAKRSIEEADEAESDARGEGSGLTGRLRVCAATTFARLRIVPRLSEFLSSYPGLEVDLVLDDRNINLVEEGIDIALRMGDLVDSTITARKLGERDRHVVATPAYLSRAGTPLTPSNLAKHDAVIYTRGGGGDAWTFTRGEVSEFVKLNGRVRASASEAIREAVLADLGFAIMAAWMCHREIKRGELVVLLPEWQLPTFALWAVFPSGRMVSAKARAFASFVEGIAQDES